MSLLGGVVARLEREQVSFCVIGAAALAAYGVSRSTLDLDLLTLDERVLGSGFWTDAVAGAIVEVRRGDLYDPLAGVVRFNSAGQREVDLIVGRSAWQRRAIERAGRASFEGLELPVVGGSDLVLLKLFAGGPQDAWDVQQLLADAQPSLIADVESVLDELPSSARALWQRLVSRE